MPKRSEKEILEALKDVECQLSPENLSCDGEATGAYMAREMRRLNKERAALVKELGREPTDNELYS